MTAYHPWFLEYLHSELQQRRKKNPKYSQRAFAKYLDIDPGLFSKILSGQRALSYATATELAKRLKLPKSLKEKFMRSALESNANRKLAKIDPEADPLFKPISAAELESSIYEILKDWYYSGVMELTFVDEFQNDPQWVASQLGITPQQAHQAVRKLIQVGVLKRINGSLKKVSPLTTTNNKDKTSQALMALQVQFLRLAIDAIKTGRVDNRDSSSLTMAIDPAKIPEAKKIIQNFRYELCRFLEDGARKQVYQLCVNLFPLHRG